LIDLEETSQRGFASDPALTSAIERAGVTSAASMAKYSEADVTAY
jgi:hypothetical protein